MDTIKIFNFELSLENYSSKSWPLANNFKTKHGWELPSEEHFGIFQMLVNAGAGNFIPGEFYWAKEKKILIKNISDRKGPAYEANSYVFVKQTNKIQTHFMDPGNDFLVKLIRKI